MKPALLFACAFLLIATNLSAINFEQRVDAQRAIERVYYNHRIWPKENPGPKPPLESILPEASLRAKVEDYLQKSNALEVYWQRPIAAQQLQSEMDRMVRETKQPSVLRELFAALANDPGLIAECLARPILADRLIHNMYSGDERFQGALKRQIESELTVTNTVEAMRSLSGSYRESLWEKDRNSVRMPPPYAEGSISLGPQEWKEWTNRLQQRVGALPVMKVSGLQEDADRYYVLAVLEKDDAKLRLATVEWAKPSFAKWWNEAKQQTRAEITEHTTSYTLSEPASNTPSTADSWTATANDPPTARLSHTAVWTGSEMIIWGGWDGVSFFDTGGRYNPSTATWAAEGTNSMNAPTARDYHTAVWTGTEMIIWGGRYQNTLLNTGGRYNPSTNTWAVEGTSTSGAPTGRESHTAVWTGSEMIIWGSWDGSNYLNTGGRYNPSTNSWAAGGTNTTGAPTGRQGHTAVWTGNEMIVWGGYNGITFLNNGGRYNPVSNTWAAGDINTTNAPIARWLHTAVWTGNEVIVWGGWGVDGYLNTGGRYNPNTNAWAAGGSSITNSPSARAEHTAVWTGAEMIIWGGWDGVSLFNTGGRYNPSTDAWGAGGTSTTNAPTAREWHTAVWTGAEMIVWGGEYSVGNLNTGGRYNPSSDTWAAGGTSTTGTPTAREHHTAIWTGAEMIIWGGSDWDGSDHHYFNTGGRYDPSTNTWTAGGTNTTNAPTARSSHTAVWTGADMIVWGGYDGLNYLTSGGRYSPTTDMWSVDGVGTTAPPQGRLGHTAIWTGSEMIVWGGVNNGFLNTGGRYNPTTNAWAAGGTSTTDAPIARYLHTAIWTGTEMIIWGGSDSDTSWNTGGRYNPATNTWASGGTSTINAPAARRLHTAVWTDTEMIVWGGYEGVSYYANGGRYNPASDTWVAGGTSTTDAPTGRLAHTAVWTGTEMIVWGGDEGANYTDTGGRYNPASDTWLAGGTSTTDAPTARRGHTVIWTGTEMIVWGGLDSQGNLNTGGVYTPGISCLFCDDFEDGVLDTDWNYIKPTWSESGGSLVAAPKKKAIAVATPCFSGCRICSVEAEMKTAGGIGNILWLLGWYVDRNNTMELLLKEDKNKIILKQRIGHAVVKKQAVKISLNPNTFYDIKIAFNGSQFDVYLDSVKIMSFVPAGVVPTGTVGFQVKRTAGSFDSITVQ